MPIIIPGKVNPLVMSYPDFALGSVINPEEFDQNNLDTRDKLNEFIAVENTMIDNIVIINTNVNTAITQSNTAISTANGAVTTATTLGNEAKGIADGAVVTANSAVTTAGSAVTTANGAVTTATNLGNQAIGIANTAATTASGAVTTANAATAKALQVEASFNDIEPILLEAVNQVQFKASTAYVDLAVANFQESQVMDGSLADVKLSNAPTEIKARVASLTADMPVLFQSVNDGKNLLETAVVDMRGTVSQAGTYPTFSELNTGIRSIPQGKGNAVPSEVLATKTFTNNDGVEYTGTMLNKAGVVQNAGSIASDSGGNIVLYSPYNGYVNTSTGLIGYDADFIASNFLETKNVFGLQGTMPNRSSAVHTLAVERAAWLPGTGGINGGAINTTPIVFYRPPYGYYNGSTWVYTEEPNLLGSNILATKNIMGVQGTIPVRTNTDTEGTYPLANNTALWEGMVYQVPPAGYYPGDVYIRQSVPTLAASNIKAGVTIGNIVGTLPSMTYTTFLTGSVPYLSSVTFNIPENTRIILLVQCDSNGDSSSYVGGATSISESRNLDVNFERKSQSNYYYMDYISATQARVYNNNGSSMYWRVYTMGW